MEIRLHHILMGALLAIILVGATPASAEERPLKIICDIWPPYQIDHLDGITGYSTEIVAHVLKAMDVKHEPVTAYPWKRALTILESNHADGLFSANYAEDRLTFARYPEEVIVDSPWNIWSRGEQAFLSMDDLKGKRIGVVIGYSYTPEFWDFIQTYCEVEKVTSDRINFRKLSMGRLDATVAEYGNGIYLVRQLGLANVAPQKALEIKRDGLYMIFNRNTVKEGFVQEFSRQLRTFKATEAHRDLQRKYLGAE